jgi:dipeptidyl-peptidase-4
MILDRFPFFWAHDQLLSDNGYVVLNVDCRTAVFRGKKWINKYRGHLYGAPERNDFVDAARWIKKQPYADPDRVGVWGWSGGGGNTLNLLCHTNEFKAGVAGAPFVDPAYYDTLYSEQLFGLPKDNPKGYEDAAVWRYAKDLHGKLLLVWGSADNNVQQQQELAFVNACIAAGKQIQMIVFPNRGHGFGDKAASKYFYQAWLDFWKENL